MILLIKAILFNLHCSVHYFMVNIYLMGHLKFINLINLINIIKVISVINFTLYFNSICADLNHL